MISSHFLSIFSKEFDLKILKKILYILEIFNTKRKPLFFMLLNIKRWRALQSDSLRFGAGSRVV